VKEWLRKTIARIVIWALPDGMPVRFDAEKFETAFVKASRFPPYQVEPSTTYDTPAKPE
jgi:hypothetical protein